MTNEQSLENHVYTKTYYSYCVKFSAVLNRNCFQGFGVTKTLIITRL